MDSFCFSVTHPVPSEAVRCNFPFFQKVCPVFASLNFPTDEPILIRAARKQSVPRPPVWLMRQAGRYMAAFRHFSDLHSFRHRSESPDIAVELSLQPFYEFATDAVIMFSDILTPLPALGIQFDIISGKGPIIPHPLRSNEHITRLTRNSFMPQQSLPFIAETLSSLRTHLEPHPDVALLGFVAAPFTLAAYLIEGRTVKHPTYVKRFMYSHSPEATGAALHTLLDYLSDVLAQYAIYQIDAGAQAVQVFDSWAHHLSPDQYADFSIPYASKLVHTIKSSRPNAIVIFFANGCAGKLSDISKHLCRCADVIGIDWSVRLQDARRELGPDVVLQGNVDPCILSCGDGQAIRDAVRDTVAQAGNHLILNLGHGVLKETPEEAVRQFVGEAKSLSFAQV